MIFNTLFELLIKIVEQKSIKIIIKKFIVFQNKIQI